MASTGSARRPGRKIPRRALLKAAALAPAALLASKRLDATDYSGPSEVFDAVDRLEADVAARLRAIVQGLPSAGAFASSVLADHERNRVERARLRSRLGLPAAPAPGAEVSRDRGLEALRAAQGALVYAHAEGLPAIGDAFSVDVLAHHMVELSRHLTVIDLWIEAEANRV